MKKKETSSDEARQFVDQGNDRRLAELMSLLAEKKAEAVNPNLPNLQADELELAIRGYDLILGDNTSDTVYQTVRQRRVAIFKEINIKLKESSYTNTYQAMLDKLIGELQLGAVPEDLVKLKQYALVALADQLVKNDAVFRERLLSHFRKTPSPTIQYLLDLLHNMGYIR